MNIGERIEALRVNIVSLHSSAHELFEASQRHDAAIGQPIASPKDPTVTMNRLANNVIRHEERLDALDGGDKQ
jgi:hypothetical protein